MGSNACAQLSNLLLYQHDVDKYIEMIYVGPLGDSTGHELFLGAIDKMRALCALEIRIFFGGGSVYEAMNIGISQARGKYLFFCGDTDTPLRDHLVSCIDSYISPSGQIGISPVLLGLVRRSYQLIKARLPKASGLGLATERNPTHHQAIIYPVEVFYALGFYSLSFRVMGDYELHLRLRSRVTMEHPQLRFIETNVVFCDFEDGGMSATGRLRNYIESFKCKKPYLKPYLLPVALIVEVIAFLNARTRHLFSSNSWLQTPRSDLS